MTASRPTIQRSPEEQATPGIDISAAERSRSTWLAVLLTSVAVTFTVLTCPPLFVEMSADVSLSAVLHYAAVKNLQFGPELVSTYGPLGYLIFPQHSDHAVTLRLATDILVCFTISLGLCLVIWRVRWVWRIVFLFLFTWAVTNVWLRTDLLLHSGLFCWGLLSIVERGAAQRLCAVGFVVLSAFCALAKVSLLFIALPTLVVIVLALLLSRKFALATISMTLFGALFVLGWVGSDQQLANLPAYLKRALTVALSYNAALGVEGVKAVHPLGIAVALLALTALCLRSLTAELPERANVWLGRGLFLLFCLFLTFTIWKHGFVRGDAYHVAFFLGFVPVLVFGIQGIPSLNRRATLSGGILGASCVIPSLLALQHFIFPPLPGSLMQPFKSLKGNLEQVFYPSKFSAIAAKALEEQKATCRLPQLTRICGNAPVDVFGQNQAYALLNGMNYQPRPVFQSYSACSADLMRANEDYFFSTTSPDLWLFQLAPLDRKFAPLEDAYLLRALLTQCELVGAEKDFLLLRRRTTEKPRLNLLEEGAVSGGQPIDLRKWGAASLWLEIDLEPSLSGWIRQVLYRPPTVRLAAWKEPGKSLLYRHQAAVPMLKAGFLASPLVARTEDVQNLFTSKGVPQPGAYTVELGASTTCWRERISYRVYSLEPQYRLGGQ